MLIHKVIVAHDKFKKKVIILQAYKHRNLDVCLSTSRITASEIGAWKF